MSVDVEFCKAFLLCDLGCDGLIHDEVFGSLNGRPDLIIGCDADPDLVHHLEVSLLTELLDLVKMFFAFWFLGQGKWVRNLAED